MTYLYDPQSIAIVFGGTLLAMLLRCGWRDCARALRAVAHLFTRAFDADKVRAGLAVQVRDIAEHGLYASDPRPSIDHEFDALGDTLVHRRSVSALFQEHERHRSSRAVLSAAALRVLSAGAELAPVLGLAGTLIALGGMEHVAIDDNYAGSIAAAVTTTLYGLVLSTFVFAPLAGAVERRAQTEEAQRKALLEWLAAKIRLSGSGKAPNRSTRRAAA